MFEMLHKKLKALIRIGKIALVSGGQTQSLQIETTKGETLDNVKLIEPYGFTAIPINGSECLVVNVGANGGNPVAVVVGGRAFRLQNLEQGEVALYTDEGDKMVFKRGRTIEMTTTKLKVIGDLEVSGKFNATGNITSAAEISDKTSNLTVIRTVFNAHQHKDSANVPTTAPLTSME